MREYFEHTRHIVLMFQDRLGNIFRDEIQAANREINEAEKIMIDKEKQEREDKDEKVN